MSPFDFLLAFGIQHEVVVQFIEEDFFSASIVFAIFVKNYLCIYMRVYFWALSSILLVSVSAFLLISCCFDYHSSVL